MAECGSYGFYPSNSPIFHQGDLGDSLYVILKGSVKMRVTNEEFGNTPVVLSTIFDGDHFGQILSMFKQNAKWYKKPRRKLSCIACEDTEVFNIPREAALFIVTNEITDALNKKVLFLKKFPFFRVCFFKVFLV
jgi:CRP-like cAMP-binding protein